MPDAPPSPSVADLLLVGVVFGFFAAVGLAALVYRVLGGRPLFAPEPRRDVPWGWKSAVGAVILWFAIVQVFVVALLISRARVASGRPIPHVSMSSVLLANAVGSLVASLAVVALLRVTSRATASDFGLGNRGLGREVLRGAAACALSLPVIFLIQYDATRVWPQTEETTHPVQTALQKDRSGRTAAVVAASAVVVAPICEELLFRGVLLAWLLKLSAPRPLAVLSEDEPVGPEPEPVPESPERRPSPSRAWGPNVLVSVLFAALHAGQWPAPIPLFCLALVMGELYRLSGSIVAPIAMHACFNGLNTAVLMILTFAGRGS